MNFLLDTCVVSETMSSTPNPKVIRWLTEVNDLTLHMSVISIGEIHKGIEKLSPSKRRKRYERWLFDELLDWLEDRLLLVDLAVALRWGKLTAETELAGKPLPAIDSILAATALEHDLIVVTRNTKHFENSGVEILNPW